MRGGADGLAAKQVAELPSAASRFASCLVPQIAGFLEINIGLFLVLRAPFAFAPGGGQVQTADVDICIAGFFK